MSQEGRSGVFPGKKGDHPEWHNPNFHLAKLIPARVWRTGSEEEEAIQPQKLTPEEMCACVFTSMRKPCKENTEFRANFKPTKLDLN